jgi:chromosome segregation ATPase
MDVAVITELVASLGLPIALVIAMGLFIYKLWQQSVAREEKLMNEIAENRLVNAKAIETIAQFGERFTRIEGDVAEIKSDIVLIKDKIQE